MFATGTAVYTYDGTRSLMCDVIRLERELVSPFLFCFGGGGGNDATNGLLGRDELKEEVL